MGFGLGKNCGCCSVCGGPQALTALGETTGVTDHAAFFKADLLTAFRTGYARKAFLILTTAAVLLIFQIPSFKNARDSIRYG
jgi:hypothetical protein